MDLSQPKNESAVPPPQQQRSAYHQQQQPHQPTSGHLPNGIPPSVSYSPTSAQNNLAPPPKRGMDPPETEGVTGYHRPPLRYGVESGRGGRGQQQGGQFSGRGNGGRAGPHLHQQYPGHPPQQGYPSNYYGPPPPMNQPPPPNQQQQWNGHPQQYHHQQHHQHPPQFQQQQPYPPHHHHPEQYHPQPQFTAPNHDRSRKKSTSPNDIFAGTVNVMHQTADAVTGAVSGLAHRVKGRHSGHKGSIQNNDFPLTTSVETDFTMSDISTFGESTMQHSMLGQSGIVNQGGKKQEDVGQGAHKNSNTSKNSGGSNSTKTNESFNVSDLMGSNQTLGLSFGHSGRTRSFPDLMLSTGDLLPPLPAEGGESETDGLNLMDQQGGEEKQPLSNGNDGGRIMRPFHRQSSSDTSNHSMTSLTIKGFHPVRGRAGTVSGINDAMSIMSLDSRKSAKSDASSWLDNFRSMQSVHSDMNPWEGAPQRGMGDEGSVRSFLSDVSNDLHALDLADPACLLPPINLNDSHEFLNNRPDP